LQPLNHKDKSALLWLGGTFSSFFFAGEGQEMKVDFSFWYGPTEKVWTADNRQTDKLIKI
jgi:hypothetical protein